jgi:hypothetical protein
MNLPRWVEEELARFRAPETGKVIVVLECYKGGVTQLEIGAHVRVKPGVTVSPPTAPMRMETKRPRSPPSMRSSIQP